MDKIRIADVLYQYIVLLIKMIVLHAGGVFMGERLLALERIQNSLQVMVLAFAYWISYLGFGWLEGRQPFNPTSLYDIITLTLLLAVWGAGTAYLRENRPELTRPFRFHLYTYLKSNVICLITSMALAYLFHFNSVSRLMTLEFAITVFILNSLTSYLMILMWRMIKKPERRLLVAAGLDRDLIKSLVSEVRRSGVDVIGVLAEKPLIEEPLYRGSSMVLTKLLESEPIDLVMIHPALPRETIERCIGECQLRGVPAELLIGDFFLLAATREVVQMPYGSAIRMLPHRYAPISHVLKRLTDIFFSAVALILLAPVMFCIVMLIKITSPGPVLFIQQRVGLRGREFPCLKFRTMVVNAEELKAKLMHLNEMSGPVFKIHNDPRVTSIGKLLRKTSLDELPQLWNVLMGHMSLVGPRPPLPSEVAQYEPWHRRRLSVRPGLTCLWQISGRNHVDFDQWMELDLRYIDNWSYIKDWWIILKTIPTVLFGRGAS